MSLFKKNSAPWTSDVLDWLASFIDSRVSKAISGSEGNNNYQRELYTVEELCGLLPGAPIHQDTVRRCIRKNRLKPLGLGFRNAKLYRIQQFEDVFQRKARMSEDKAQEHTKQGTSPFTKVLARRTKSKKAS